jgi:acetylornithine/N-succinyldiaminopimelate aminotransferase
MTHAELWERHKAVMPAWLALYYEEPIEIVQGSGRRVTDGEGNTYLDFFAGILTNAIGYDIAEISDAVREQLASGIAHTSTVYLIRKQIELAEQIAELSGIPDAKVFFANSGTEAVEAAFKLARRHGNNDAGGKRVRILALENAFHGRTMGALALTWKQAYREPFEPLPGGVEHLPAGDADALRAAVDETVAAVFIEPIQGEAGVRGYPEGYLQLARELTREAGALLIFDEVQTGIGRTGKWFASEGVLPDAMTLAKGLGAGFPIGAMITFGPDVSTLLTAGQHGTTFGGNPVATAAALATLHTIESQQLLEHVRQTGQAVRAALAGLDFVTEVRGEGLLIGFDLAAEAAPALVQRALDAGFIVNSTGPATIRLAPPLIVTAEQVQRFIDVLPDLYAAATKEEK